MTKSAQETLSNNQFDVTVKPHDLLVHSKFGGSVMVPIIANNNTFILLCIKRRDGQEHLEFPRGFSKQGEAKMDTAIRELKEETNLSADIVQEVGSIMPDSGISDNKVSVFECLLDMSEQDLHLQKSEQISGIRILNKHDLLDAVKNGEIVDSYTLSAITMLESRNS